MSRRLYSVSRSVAFSLTLSLCSGIPTNTSSAAQTPNDLGLPTKPLHWKGLQPIILFTEYNPWAMLVGGDTPSVALYVDGTVIFWQGDRRSGRYMTAHLTPAQTKNFFSPLTVQDIASFHSDYSLTQTTDQTTNKLVVLTSQGYKTISVYGDLRDGYHHEAGSDDLPAGLQSIFSELVNYSVPDAKPWMPDFLEVVIWPFEYARGKPVNWPATWPDLSDPKTVRRGNSYSIYLPVSRLEEFRTFSKRIGPKQAVLIDKKKWTLLARYPFPHEIELSDPLGTRSQ
jgi:hypothetical protein